MFLTTDDLAPFAPIADDKAEAMIEDAEAQAVLVAPCITSLAPNDPKYAAVRAILRGAVLRWNDAGSGGVTTNQRMSGPYSEMQVIDNTKQRRGAFWPSEIEQLQRICAGDPVRRAYAVDTMPAGAGASGVERTWVTPTDWVIP